MIVDITEDPFKQFDASIVGNIVDYNSSDEEIDPEPKSEDAPSKKKIELSIKVATSSIPLTIVLVTPSTPPTQAAKVTIQSRWRRWSEEPHIFIK